MKLIKIGKPLNAAYAIYRSNPKQSTHMNVLAASVSELRCYQVFCGKNVLLPDVITLLKLERHANKDDLMLVSLGCHCHSVAL